MHADTEPSTVRSARALLRFLPVLLLALVRPGPAAGQALDLPDRAPDAPTGARLAAELRGFPLEAREARIVDEILAGNVPSWLRTLRPVHLEGPRGTTLTVRVAPDYLAVGSDADWLLVPLTPRTAQSVADALDASLPTPRLVDAIWSAAEVKLDPSPIPPGPEMTTVPVFAAHSTTVAEQGRAEPGYPGALTAGHKKDVVVSAALASSPGQVAIYGWHRLDGTPIQPLYLGHTDDWVDYSHGIRLVAREILVDGEPVDLWAALRDPDLAPALSAEGVLREPRYRTEGAGAGGPGA